MQGMIDKFDLIECFERPGCDLRIGEMTVEQKNLYSRMGINPPS